MGSGNSVLERAWFMTISVIRSKARSKVRMCNRVEISSFTDIKTHKLYQISNRDLGGEGRRFNRDEFNFKRIPIFFPLRRVKKEAINFKAQKINHFHRISSHHHHCFICLIFFHLPSLPFPSSHPLSSLLSLSLYHKNHESCCLGWNG